jgi:predicted permease
MLRPLLARLSAILGRGASDADLDDELRFHLEHQIEKHVAAGLSRDAARRRAHLEFGGLDVAREQYREVRGIRPLEALIEGLKEVRRAVRMLARTPAFTAVATLSLGLGIGAASAIFSIADAELLRPLPVPDAGAVMSVATASADERGSSLSYPNYGDLRDSSRAFAGLIAYRRPAPMTFARSSRDVREVHLATLVSDNFFEALKVRPAIGRLFAPDEGRVPGRDAIVVLGHHFWTNTLGANPSVLNSVVWINGVAFTVIGIAEPAFTGMDESIPAFFVPATMAERVGRSGDNPLTDRSARVFGVKGRLRPGVSRESAQAELATVWAGLQQRYPEANSNLSIAVRTQLQERIQEEGPVTTITIGLVGGLVAVVLIIACANVASLMLGRARARTREVAIRLALGIGRARLLRQLLVESLVLASAGCALGVGLAWAGLRFILAAQPPGELRVVVAPELDGRMLIVSLVAAVASAVLCGMAPAWQSLKTQLVSLLKSSEPGSGRHRAAGRRMLVVSQVALSMMLLVVMVAMVDGFRKVLVADPGVRTDRVLIAKLDTATAGYTPEQTASFYSMLETRVRALPGVESVALTSHVPLDRGGDFVNVIPEGYQLPRGRKSIAMASATVDDQYFATVNTAIARGRAFTPADRADSRGVAIVNEEFARLYWPGRDPLGRRLRLDGASNSAWLEVVGVTRTGKYLFVAEPPTPFLYLPSAQQQRTAMSLLVQAPNKDAAMLAGPVREAVRDLDVNQPVVAIRTLSDLYAQRAIRVPLQILRLVSTIGLIGLTLTLVGLYGVVAYSVSRRTREIGLRMAVGAAASDVLMMVIREGLTISTIGIAIGGVASVFIVRAVAAGMAGLGAPNPAIYVAAPLTLVMLTLAASYMPARRASGIDPLRALREE